MHLLIITLRMASLTHSNEYEYHGRPLRGKLLRFMKPSLQEEQICTMVLYQ